MSSAPPHSFTKLYALYGALFGACFPVGATLLDAYLRFDLRPSGLLQAQLDQPLHWVIDSAPFWLGLFAAMAGRRQDLVAMGLAEIRVKNEVLRQANDELVRARQLKSEFLANVSHELRTPLNAIIGFSRIVLRKSKGVLPEKQVKNLTRIHDSGLTLLDIVNDLLDIERIEAGMMAIKRGEVQIDRVVTEVVETLQPAAQEKEIHLGCEVSPADFAMETDEIRLRQILTNLVVNAIKYSDSGRVWVDARLVPDGDGEALQVAVRDEGIGISAEHLGAIFEAFKQVDGSATRRQGGVGLGLHLVKKLSKMLGGDITVESTVGQGSVFTLVVPAKVVRRGAEGPEDVLAPMGEGPLLLVIDDHRPAIELLQMELAEEGFRVHGALSGSSGLEKAKRIRPDAILLDMLMPEMDGWQVLVALADAPDLVDIPVIVVSSADPSATPASREVAAWLPKPLGVSAFKEVFASVALAKNADILIVEDDLNTVSLLRQHMRELALPCRTAVDGDQAVSALRDRMPGAVILDIGLPGRDGLAVLDTLRGMPGGADVMVVVYTAQDLEKETIQTLQGGEVTYIGKGSSDGLENVGAFVRRALAAGSIRRDGAS